MAKEALIKSLRYLPLHTTGKYFSNCNYRSSTTKYFFSTTYLTQTAFSFEQNWTD